MRRKGRVKSWRVREEGGREVEGRMRRMTRKRSRREKRREMEEQERIRGVKREEE